MQNISDSNSEHNNQPNKWLLAREMADAIIQYAKTNNCVVLVESHVKKYPIKEDSTKVLKMRL